MLPSLFDAQPRHAHPLGACGKPLGEPSVVGGVATCQGGTSDKLAQGSPSALAHNFTSTFQLSPPELAWPVGDTGDSRAADPSGSTLWALEQLQRITSLDIERYSLPPMPAIPALSPPPCTFLVPPDLPLTNPPGHTHTHQPPPTIPEVPQKDILPSCNAVRVSPLPPPSTGLPCAWGGLQGEGVSSPLPQQTLGRGGPPAGPFLSTGTAVGRLPDPSPPQGNASGGCVAPGRGQPPAKAAGGGGAAGAAVPPAAGHAAPAASNTAQQGQAEQKQQQLSERTARADQQGKVTKAQRAKRGRLEKPVETPAASLLLGGQEGCSVGNCQGKQLSNKLAQQRYRERKRKEDAAREKQIEGLKREVLKLREVQQRNVLLEGQISELEARLAQQEDDVRHLLMSTSGSPPSADTPINATSASQLPAGAQSPPQGGPPQKAPQSDPAGPPTHTHPHLGVRAGTPTARTAGAGAGPGFCNATGTSSHQSSDGGAISCEVQEEFQGCLKGCTASSVEGDTMEEAVAALRDWLAARQLLPAQNPHPGTPPRPLPSLTPPDLAALSSLLGRCCQLCQGLIHREGPAALAKMAPELMSWRQQDELALWDGVVQVLQLTTHQAAQLLLLRQSHLQKLEGIYAERQTLQVQAMGMMLPFPRGLAESRTGVGSCAAAVAAGGWGLEAVAQWGSLANARVSSELVDTLDSIKANTRREVLAMIEMNKMAASRILTPLQTALYVVSSFPRQCDVLAMMNAVERKREAAERKLREAKGAGGRVAKRKLQGEDRH